MVCASFPHIQFHVVVFELSPTRLREYVVSYVLIYTQRV